MARCQRSEVLTSQISLAQPDRSGPKTKTLLELATEREASLHPPSSSSASSASKTAVTSTTTQPAPQSTVDALLISLLQAITLSALHMTLTLLVHHQYAQTPPSAAHIPALLLDTIKWTLPTVFLMVFPLHTHTAFRFPLLRQLLFFAAGVAAGAHLIWIGNLGGYLAVMRKVPGVATVAVWCVVESRWEWSLMGLGGVGLWAWWNGLGAF